MNRNDTEIAQLFSAKDQSAVAEVKKKYGNLCYSIAFNILRSKEDAEECISDVYINLWSCPPTVENFKAYLCKLTKNLALTKLKYNTAEKRRSDLKVSLSELEEMAIEIAAEDDLGDRELGEIISRFLRAQNPDERNVFVRRYWYMDSVNDIAAKYSFSVSKVKSMLYHTRNRLKRYLKKEGIDI